MKIRLSLAQDCQRASPFSGGVEGDEFYFGARRVRGKGGRGESGKTIVFGIFKRNGKVHTEIVPDVTKDTLLQIVKSKATLDSTIHTDGFREWNTAKQSLQKLLTRFNLFISFTNKFGKKIESDSLHKLSLITGFPSCF